MSRLSDIDFEDGKTPIPKEICNYYTEHGYDLFDIPLDAYHCKQIAKILDMLSQQPTDKIKKETERICEVEVRAWRTTAHYGAQFFIDGKEVEGVLSICEYEKGKNFVILWYEQEKSGSKETHFVKASKFSVKDIDGNLICGLYVKDYEIQDLLGIYKTRENYVEQ